MDFFLDLMDESATFLVETPFVALGLIAVFAFLCWWGAIACAKGQEMGQ